MCLGELSGAKVVDVQVVVVMVVPLTGRRSLEHPSRENNLPLPSPHPPQLATILRGSPLPPPLNAQSPEGEGERTEDEGGGAGRREREGDGLRRSV